MLHVAYLSAMALRGLQIANRNMAKIGSHNRVVAVASPTGKPHWIMRPISLTKLSGGAL